VRRAALVLLCVAACKGKDAKKDAAVVIPPHPMPEAPVVVPGDWGVCKAALAANPKLPAGRQVAALIDACKPCGDWTPLIEWNKLTEDGGPKRKDIESAMIGCKAYCDPNAKMRFQGSLDDERGKTNRLPWRVLGEFCKESLSAVPDARYMSAPFFALDRIARDAAARPDGAPLLAAIDLQLPAVSITGAGVALPETSVTKPAPPSSSITLTADGQSIGALQHGKLSDKGVTATGDLYPGSPVKLADLPAAIEKLPQPVLVFAPKKLPATRLVELLAVTKARPLFLADPATCTLPGWDIYGSSPVELVGQTTGKPAVKFVFGETTDDIIKQIAGSTPASPVVLELEPTATIQSVATVLGALAYKDVKTAVITAAPTKRSKP